MTEARAARGGLAARGASRFFGRLLDLLGRPGRREWAFAAALGVPFGVSQALGWFVARGGELADLGAGDAALCAAASLVLAALAAAAFAALLSRVLRPCASVSGSGASRRSADPRTALGRALRRMYDRDRLWPRAWLTIAACWLPACAALFPGVLAYDPLYELKWALSDGVTTSFHTLAHSAWLSASVALGRDAFGSAEAGLALYTVAQVLLLSGVLACCVAALRRFGAPFWSQMLALAWFSLFPAHAVLAMTATKDVAFTAFLVLSVVLLCEAVRDPKRFFARARGPLALAGALLLMFAFRKNALYAFIAAGPFLVAACPGARGRAAGLCAACLAVGVLYFGPVHGALCDEDAPTVPPAGSTEALSVPLQQLARAMVWEGKGLGAETFAAAESYVPAWRSYDERIADPLKFGSGNRRVEEDPAGFLSVWAQVGALRPAVYADAWLSLSHGFWYLGFRYSDFSQGRPYLEWRSVPREAISDGDADAFVYIGQTGPAALRETAGRFMDRMPWDSVPVLSWLFNPGLFAWVLIASATSCLYLRRYRLAAALALPLAYLATCLLGPTLLIRYAYPLFALAPFALGMPFVREGGPL